MIRGESVVLIAVQSRTGGAGIDSAPEPKRLPSFRENLMTKLGMSYDAASAYIERYNDMVDHVNEVNARYANRAASSLTNTVSDLTETATPLGDAEPFELGDDVASGEGTEIAGMPFHGVPGSWISSMPGTMPQMRQYGLSGTPLTDFDFEAHHGNTNPHAHNWDGYDRDEGAPVSILPW